MKQRWLERYSNAVEQKSFDAKVLLGFNTNIDIRTCLEESEIDLSNVESGEMREISSEEEFLSVLKFCRENNRNIEVSRKGFDPGLQGRAQIGGQAGIMSNFLSKLGNRSVLYTPFLSENLVDMLEEDVVYPVADDGLVLKSVSEAVNSDRTKKNYIVEFEDSSSRAIFSESIRGFGPYFRKGVEEKFPELQEAVDRAIFSGFHDVEGNVESKLRKAEKQLKKLHIPKHVEFVSTTEKKDRIILERILPCFTSVGLDSSELVRVSDYLGYEIEEEPSLGEAYTISKKIIEEFNVSRVHVHTKRFQSVVAESEYPVKDERIRESMLFGSASAVAMAETGRIPGKDDIDPDNENSHLTRLDDLEDFQKFFDLDNFVRTGTTRLEEYKIIAVPTLIHEKPERIVGMGDIISSAAFTGEIYR